MKLILQVLFAFLAFGMYAQAVGAVNEQDEKVYLSADQVNFCENSLIAFLENEGGTYTKVIVPQINCDENGLFVWASLIPASYASVRCPKFHPSVCPKCFGCGVSRCPYKCRC